MDVINISNNTEKKNQMHIETCKQKQTKDWIGYAFIKEYVTHLIQLLFQPFRSMFKVVFLFGITF